MMTMDVKKHLEDLLMMSAITAAMAQDKPKPKSTQQKNPAPGINKRRAKRKAQKAARRNNR